MKIIFEIIMYIFSALGGIVSIWTIYKWLRPQKSVSWKKVEKGVVELKEQLINDKYYPTLIIGIGRGGAVISALLSGVLGNVPIIIIDRVYKWSNHQRQEGLCDEIKISKNIERVLIVAGELHSGNTAKKYTEHFTKIGSKEVKMLTFMKEPYPTFKPDYFYIETKHSDIRFPWMITKEYKRESQLDYKNK